MLAPHLGRMGDRMKGPEGPGRKGNQPQNESEADFHSREVSGIEGCGNGLLLATHYQLIEATIPKQSEATFTEEYHTAIAPP